MFLTDNSQSANIVRAAHVHTTESSLDTIQTHEYFINYKNISGYNGKG